MKTLYAERSFEIYRSTTEICCYVVINLSFKDALSHNETPPSLKEARSTLQKCNNFCSFCKQFC